MTNRKNTRRALVLSLLSLLLCCSMLVGTTFAWFTDSVTSGKNTIIAGNLDIELEYSKDMSGWADVKEADSLFSGNLWEPGHTEVVYLKLSNLGTLALKYRFTMSFTETTGTNVAGETFALSEYLRYAIVDVDSAFADRNAARDFVADEAGALAEYSAAGEMLPTDAPILMAMVVYMPEEVGNEANYLTGTAAPTIDLALNLLAAQLTYEEDSWDDQYDADVAIPGKFDITNADELGEAMANGGEGTVLNGFDEAFAKLPATNQLVLDLGGNTVSGGTVATGDIDGGDAAFENRGTLTIRNGVIESDYITVDNKSGTLTLENLALNTTDLLYGFYNRTGETVMNDVTIHSKRGGLNIQGGKVVLDGVTVEVDGFSNKVGYGIYAEGNQSVEVIVENAEFVYNQGYTKYSVIYAGKNASVIINGGTFGNGGSGHKSGGWIRSANGGTVTIYGGTFQFDPSAFVAEGYEAVKGDNGWWTVSQK